MYASGVRGTVEIYPEYAEGLRDLDGFSHVYLLYVFHLAGPPKLQVKPFLDNQERGVFATRSPRRPNALGMSLVKLISCKDLILEVDGIDILDGTPLLDIKPYVSRFEQHEDARFGWVDLIPEDEARRRGRRR